MTPFQILVLLSICLVWSFHAIVIRTSVELVSPLIYVAFRMPILALILLPVLKWHNGQMRQVLLGGLFYGGLNYAFLFSGFAYTTASVGAVVIESYVVIATLFSVIFLGERIGWRRGLGIAAALVGVLTIALADGDATGSRNLPLGASLLFMMAVCEATGSLLVKKIKGVRPIELLAWFAVVGAVVQVTLATFFASDHFAWLGSPHRNQLILALLYSVCAASLFGHTAYYYLLQRVPLSIVATSGILVTVLSVFFGVVLLGEALTPRVVIGSGLVLAGVAVMLIRGDDRARIEMGKGAAKGTAVRRSDVQQKDEEEVSSL